MKLIHKSPIESNIHPNNTRNKEVNYSKNTENTHENDLNFIVNNNNEIKEEELDPKQIVMNQRTQTQILQKLVQKLDKSHDGKPKHVLSKEDVWRGDKTNMFLTQSFN